MRPQRAAPESRFLASRFRAFARAVSWHRRKLAVVAAVLTVLTGVNAALPPDPPSTSVVQLTAPLDGGAVLEAADVRLVRMPSDAVPEDALGAVSEAVGQTLAAPLTKGTVLTGVSVVTDTRGVRPGQVVAPLRLADADVVALLRVGEIVDVVAADTEAPKAAVVARGVRVLALPRAPDSSGIGGSVGNSAGALVLVEVSSATATTLAQAAVTATLSVVLR